MRDFPEELLGSLVDPDTHRPLRRATDRELERLRDRVRRGAARRRDGGDVPGSFEGAFLTEDGGAAYLVVEGIPSFLIDERLELDEPMDAA
ncbi:MAG: hypothetical protein ACODAU_12870 [Myxococcota bacterium]